MQYNFEQFNDFKSKFKPTISLCKTGGFGFSSGFMKRYNIKSCHYLKIFFDKEKNAVAFIFLEKEEEGAVKFKNRGSSGFFKSNSFLGKYDIDPNKFSDKYEPKIIKTNDFKDMYVIELKEINNTEPDDTEISIANIPF